MPLSNQIFLEKQIMTLSKPLLVLHPLNLTRHKSNGPERNTGGRRRSARQEGELGPGQSEEGALARIGDR